MKTFLQVLIYSLICIACTQKKEDKGKSQTLGSLLASEIMIADTITYNTDIKNADNDDYYAAHFLDKVNREALLTCLVNDVLTGKLEPFDYFTGKKLSAIEIKNILKQEDYKNSKFAQIQFQERWTYDQAKQQLTKKVYSMVLGFEILDKEGNLKGYKPAFKVNLNN